TIVQNPESNPLKTGDLSDLRVYKYKQHGALLLLAYHYNKQEQIINLVAIGPHENFYRDLKR
ncbi:MAG: type II toxin-antitoxin system RelE/ParE family toxin, partial [Mariprofundaceae bacterium]|nr:type II toxin-antitoxin system RelE/ParE family toxin [Mariprofundaceae bacterium]